MEVAVSWHQSRSYQEVLNSGVLWFSICLEWSRAPAWKPRSTKHKVGEAITYSLTDMRYTVQGGSGQIFIFFSFSLYPISWTKILYSGLRSMSPWSKIRSSSSTNPVSSSLISRKWINHLVGQNKDPEYLPDAFSARPNQVCITYFEFIKRGDDE